jgi:hypothetical protein
VGGRQRDAADGLDLFELGGVIVAGGQGATMHTEGVFGIVGAQVGRPVVEVFLAPDGDWGEEERRGGGRREGRERERRRRDEARERGDYDGNRLEYMYGVWSMGGRLFSGFPGHNLANLVFKMI